MSDIGDCLQLLGLEGFLFFFNKTEKVPSVCHETQKLVPDKAKIAHVKESRLLTVLLKMNTSCAILSVILCLLKENIGNSL